MHPVLFEFPLPHWNVALAPCLVALSLLALVVCALGWRSKSRDLLLAGLGGSVIALSAAVLRRGERIEIGPFAIYSFGALLSCALLSGWITTIRLARTDGLPERATLNACLAASVAGFLGARILYVLTNPRDFEGWSDVVAFQSGGLTFYGGAVAGGLASFWILRKDRVAFLRWADSASPGLALALGIGRIGCYLAGCDYGTVLSARAPTWIKRMGTFPKWPDEVAGAAAGSPAWVEHVLSRRIPLAAKASLPVHPTELYEATIAFALFVGLVALRSRRRVHGQLFASLVVAYGAVRFVLETLRGDPERGHWGPFSASQWLAALCSVATVAVALRLYRTKQLGRETA